MTSEEEEYDNIEIVAHFLIEVLPNKNNKNGIICAVKSFTINGIDDPIIFIEFDKIKVIYDVTFEHNELSKQINYMGMERESQQAQITDKAVDLQNLNEQSYIIGVTENGFMYITDSAINY